MRPPSAIAPALAALAAGMLLAGGPAAAIPPPPGERIAALVDVARGVDVAVTDGGRAVVSWTAAAGPRRGVVVRQRSSPAGAWSPERRIGTEIPVAGTEAVASISPEGLGAVAWLGASGLHVMVRPAGAAGWRAAPAPPAAAGFTSPSLAAGRYGVTTLAWVERDAAGHWTARRATFRRGGWDPDPPLDLQAAGVVSDPSAPATPVVAVGERGDTVIGWPGAAGSADRERVAPVRVVTRRGRAGGVPGQDRWGPVETLSGAGHELALGAGAALEASDAGYLAAAWQEGDRIRAAVRDPAAAAFPPSEDLGAGSAGFPVVAVNAEGYAVAAWAGFEPGRAVLTARRRSGASGLWGPPRRIGTLETDAVLELAAMQAAIDRRRVASVAWPDPLGPGAATAELARISSGEAVTRAPQLSLGADTQDLALSAGSAGATVVAHRTDPDSEPNTTMLALVVDPPGRVVLSASQLLVNQRIGQAALRRSNAVLERLRAIRGEHLRDGSIGAADLGPSIAVAGTASGTVPPGAITPLVVPPGGTGGTVTLSSEQMLIGQRIAQAALRRAGAGRNLLGRLGGANVVDGQIAAAEIAPGLTITGTTTPSRAPVGAFPPGDIPLRPPVRLPLTAGQLLINQRIAQEAVLRAGWLVEHLDGGLTGADLQGGSLDPADLGPALRSP